MPHIIMSCSLMVDIICDNFLCTMIVTVRCNSFCLFAQNFGNKVRKNWPSLVASLNAKYCD